MITTLTRASWTAVSRRGTRSLLTIVTIAAAVSGLGIFAMPSLLGNAMLARVQRDRIYDAWIPTTDVALTDAQLTSLRNTEGVRDLQARTLFETRMHVGARQADVLLVGVPSFTAQPVDAVQRDSGRDPRAGE